MQGEDRLRVLVVEDDESTRLMLQTNLDQRGLPLDTLMYVSAMEALLKMLNVDGFEFLKTLSAHNLFSNLAVVVMTGMCAKELKAKADYPMACNCCKSRSTWTGCMAF